MACCCEHDNKLWGCINFAEFLHWLRTCYLSQEEPCSVEFNINRTRRMHGAVPSHPHCYGQLYLHPHLLPCGLRLSDSAVEDGPLLVPGFLFSPAEVAGTVPPKLA